MDISPCKTFTIYMMICRHSSIDSLFQHSCYGCDFVFRDTLVTLGSHRITLSIGSVGASRKSPTDAPWETLSLRLSRSISAEKTAHRIDWAVKRRIKIIINWH